MTLGDLEKVIIICLTAGLGFVGSRALLDWARRPVEASHVAEQVGTSVYVFNCIPDIGSRWCKTKDNLHGVYESATLDNYLYESPRAWVENIDECSARAKLYFACNRMSNIGAREGAWDLYVHERGETK